MVKVKVKGYDDLVTIVGNLLDVVVGAVLLVEGQWKVDKKYGQQFLAETWEETMPAILYGIEKYLGSGLEKGVGPVFAQRIVRVTPGRIEEPAPIQQFFFRCTGLQVKICRS